jgi:hypothetical protein
VQTSPRPNAILSHPPRLTVRHTTRSGKNLKRPARTADDDAGPGGPGLIPAGSAPPQLQHCFTVTATVTRRHGVTVTVGCKLTQADRVSHHSNCLRLAGRDRPSGTVPSGGAGNSMTRIFTESPGCQAEPPGLIRVREFQKS